MFGVSWIKVIGDTGISISAADLQKVPEIQKKLKVHRNEISKVHEINLSEINLNDESWLVTKILQQAWESHDYKDSLAAVVALVMCVGLWIERSRVRTKTESLAVSLFSSFSSFILCLSKQ